MKRKSTNYSTAESGGWRNKADDLFLARFRGRPCAVCGARNGFDGSKNIRSCGHHMLEKGLHRAHRYNPENIIILCPKHHMGGEMSPHSHDGVAIKKFYEWLTENHPEKAQFMDDHRHDKFRKEWKYRDKYVELGGEIGDKSSPMKSWRPKNHAKKVREAEDE